MPVPREMNHKISHCGVFSSLSTYHLVFTSTYKYTEQGAIRQATHAQYRHDRHNLSENNIQKFTEQHIKEHSPHLPHSYSLFANPGLASILTAMFCKRPII